MVLEAGVLLGRLERGERLVLRQSRPMPSIGARCHERRIVDERTSWRIVHRLDGDAVIIADVFRKTTTATPKWVIEDCQRRLREYDAATRDR